MSELQEWITTGFTDNKEGDGKNHFFLHKRHRENSR